MLEKQLKNEVDDLLYLQLEGSATPAQEDTLNRLIKSNEQVRRYVVDYYHLAAALRKGNLVVRALVEEESQPSELNDLLAEMAAYEKNAPSVDIEPIVKSDRLLQSPSPSISVDRKVSRYSIGMLITTAAALIMLIAYVHFMTPKESVAMVVDSIGGRWQGARDVETGSLFNNTDDPWVLNRGIVEIEFDSGARLVAEAPCKFVCKSDNQIKLTYGRIYARVPSSAIGFTVQTSNSRIVDLGTEFGVQANIDGTTETHVFKGLTKLLTGKKKDTQAVSVTAGQAKQVNSESDEVKDIKFKENRFVQQIDSEMNLIRRGQKTIDLADIVGDGNGFGSGSRNIGVHPETGQLCTFRELDREADNHYHAVTRHPFIDGVFVPNGNTNQVISTLGHIFAECPNTQSNYFSDVLNSPELIDGAQVVLDNVNYSNGKSTLFMHANLGITYDLQKIRSQYDGIGIRSFSAKVGVCNSSWRPCHADFWILVDGKLRYSRQGVTQKGLLDELTIELDSKDRFLTLITTDGGDPEVVDFQDGIVTSIDSDWCVFAEPVLTIK